MPVNDATGIDYAEMAKASAAGFAQALKESGMNFVPPGAPPKTVNEFEAKLEEIAKNPESDQATVNTLKDLFASFKKDMVKQMTAEQQEESAKTLKTARDNTALSRIDEAIDAHMPEGSVAERHKESIRNRVVSLFNTGDSKEILAARKLYERGEIDIKLLNKLVSDEIAAFGTTPTQSRTSSGMSNKDKASESAAAMSSTGASTADTIDPIKDLHGKERDLWNARMSTFQRTKLGSTKTKEATAAARAYAWSGVENMRNSKNKQAEARR